MVGRGMGGGERGAGGWWWEWGGGVGDEVSGWRRRMEWNGWEGEG